MWRALVVGASAASAQFSPVVLPFSLSDVTLPAESRLGQQTAVAAQLLLSLNVSNLGCQITASANLTGTYVAPTCVFVDESHYFGHFFGHFMSATALMFNSTGAVALRQAGGEAVSLLARAQAAWATSGRTSAGYVFSAPTLQPWEELLVNGTSPGNPTVPFYIYHKLLSGLLDQHVLAGNEQAYTVMLGMLDWAVGAVADTLARGGQALLQRVLATEFGGMNDVLYSAYALTGNETYLATAGLFTHWNWTDPLVLGVDALVGNHANTHLPQVMGDAKGWELTGNATKASIVRNFFHFLNASHTYATGGSNDHQFWGPPNALGAALDDDTEESCTQYNALKVSRALFTWTGGADTVWADYYERALWNGVVGNLAVLTNASTGAAVPSFIKYLPLGGPNLTKPWAPAQEKFVCCWGTLSESFSKLGDSIFFASPDGAALLLNQFVPSTVTWAAHEGVTLTQATSFPYDPTFTATRVSVTRGGDAPWTLSLRVPFWASSGAGGGNVVEVNGVVQLPAPRPGAYYNLTRSWSEGDVVTLVLPMAVRWEPLADSSRAYAHVGALLYGPLLLAGVNVTTACLAVDTTQPLDAQVVRVDGGGGNPLTFAAPVRLVPGGPTSTAYLIPLVDVVREVYTVYWNATTTL